MVKTRQCILVQHPFVHGLWLLLTRSTLYRSTLLKCEAYENVIGFYQAIRRRFENLRPNNANAYFHLLILFNPLLTDAEKSCRNMRHEVDTLVKIRTGMFWNVIQYSVVDGCRRFGGTSFLHIHHFICDFTQNKLAYISEDYFES
jgi:hypothetical protein